MIEPLPCILFFPVYFLVKTQKTELNKFYNGTPTLIIDITKIQSNLFKGPPLSDNHLSKMTNTESAQANSHIIITV